MPIMESLLVFFLMRPSPGGLTLLNYLELASSVGTFYKLRHYVPLDTLISIYYALFCPFLTYGIVFWGATCENLLKPVLTAQKKVIRAITCSEPTAHSSPLFSGLKILKLAW